MLRREIYVSKSIGLALFLERNLLFFLVLLCTTGQFPSTSPRAAGGGGRGESLYLEGRFNGRFFALRVWGAYIWRGLFSEFYGMPRGGYFIGGTVPTEPSAGGKIFQPVENTSSAV